MHLFDDQPCWLANICGVILLRRILLLFLLLQLSSASRKAVTPPEMS